MKLLWSIAWRNLWRQRRRSLSCVLAMAVGVALSMAMIAVTDGMYDGLFDILIGQRLGHAQLHHPDYPSSGQLHDTLPGRTALLESVEALPGTVAASARLSGFALLAGEELSAGAQLVGIDPVQDRRVTPLQDRVVEGAYLGDAPGGEILLGRGLARELELGVGSEVAAVVQAADGSTGNELFTVAGLYESGDMAMDDSGAYLHLADAEALFCLEDHAHGIMLLTGGPGQVEAYVDSVQLAVGSETVQVQSWREASPSTAVMMGMRHVATAIMLGMVFGVAAFGVANVMLMSVYERTRELGVLRALGLRPGQLVRLVVLETLLLAAIATAIGLVAGGLLDWYLVVYGLDFSSRAPGGFSFEGVWLEPVVRGAVRPVSILATVVAVFVVSVLASLWPAWQAAKVQPVVAMRES